jgi:pre-mRNA-splicing factor CWC22
VVAAQPAAAAAKLPGRTGGAYIPPFKLAQMLKEVEDKSSPEYQRMTWDALRKSINGLVNKVRRSSVVKQGTSARG